MTKFHHGSAALGRINKKFNDKKYFCHFTGFLEGLASSGYLEVNEVAPLIAECIEFVRRVSDNDADDIIQDFDSDLLEFEIIESCARNRADEIDPTCEKSGLNRLLGFCRGVVCDGKITILEAQSLVNRISMSNAVSDVIGLKQILNCCIDAIQDGIVDSQESLEICNAISEVVGDCFDDTGLSGAFGTASFEEYKISNLDEELNGVTIVLTGNFTFNPRSILERKLEEFGAEIAKSPTKKTHYLIIGGEASRDWIEMNRGTKIRTALGMRETSEFPRFVSESRILRLLEGK
jgi:NAD-dependent DNA ligase